MRKILSLVFICLALGLNTYVHAQCNGNAPIINTFSPNTGFIGSTVTITGANFDPTPASNQVFFGATQATVQTASFGVLTVTVPVGATTAPISVKNGCNLTAYSPVSFNGIFCPTPLNANTYNNTAFQVGAVGAYNMLSQDLDGDGKPDVVSAYNGITVARNISTPGNLNFQASHFGTAGNYNAYISTADFDGDGKRDLFGTHNLYRNTSTGVGNINFTIHSFSSLVVGGATNGYQSNVGDFNNDGKIDVVIDNAGGTMFFYRNTSTGPGNISFAFAGSMFVQFRSTGVQIVDADADGKVDVLATQGDGNRLIALRNTTTAGATTFTFGGLQAFGTGGAYPYRCQIADFDKDGKIDLATVNYNSPLNSVNTAILRNTSSVGSISFASAITYQGPQNNYRIGVGDVNGDGYPDIVTKSLAVQAFAVYANTSSAPGSISFAPRFDYSSAATAEVSGIVIGDLDGDFVPDIATSGTNSGTIRFHRNTSAQTDNTPPTALCKNIIVALSPSGTVTVTPQMIDNGSGDACGIGSLKINGASSVTFTCNNIGNNTVTLTVTDKAGNVSTCTATVSVAPAAIIVSGQTTVCQGQTVTMNANQGDSYQWYNNGNVIPGATSQTYVATVSGNYTVEVTNAGGCSGVSSATSVTVNNNPTVSTTPSGNASLCPPGGTVTLSASLSSIYQWKLNGNNIANATQQTLVVNAAGSYSVQVIDLFGCSATSAPIVVNATDNIPPVAKCKNVTVALDANESASVSLSDINDGSSDNCGIASITLSGITSYNCSHVGQSIPVTLTVTDNSGNVSTCTALVMVTDPNSYCNAAPVAVCQPVTVSADGNCKGNAIATAFDGGSTDADGDVLTYSVTPAGPYPVGSTTVTLTVTDPLGASSSCTTTITVVDNTPPTITAPSNVTVNAAPGLCSANVEIPTAAIQGTSCLTGYPFVTPLVVNSANSTTLTDYQVKVVLNTQQIIAAGNMKPDGSDIRFVTANCSQLNYWIESGINTASTIIWVKVPVIAANSQVALTMLSGNPSASAASSGTATFDMFDDFEDGNTTGWSFGGGTWSVVNVAGNKVLNASNGGYGAGGAAVLASTIPLSEYVVETDYFPIYSDSYGGPLFEFDNFQNYYAFHTMPDSDDVMQSLISGGSPNYGFAWGYAHNHGQWFNFRVERSSTANKIYFNQAYLGNRPKFFSDGAGLWTWANTSNFDNFRVRKYADLVPTVSVGVTGFAVSDNCAIASVINSYNNTGNASGSYPVGTTTITWTVTDVNGNIATGTQTVTVIDNQPPVPNVANLPTVNAECAASVASPTATDNCGGVINGVPSGPTSFNTQGTHTITWTYTDAAGNSSTQTQTVVIDDNTPPVIACPFDIVVNAEAGTCGATVNYNQPSATDNCGSGTLPTSIPGYTYKGTFGGHTYFLSNSQAVPETAHANAIALGGHLATISSAAENAFISAMHPDRMWIGYTDRDSEGTYRWVTNEPITYTNWAGGEPNNCCGGPGEDWAVINWSGPTWNDWFYTQPAYYVVEFEGGNIPTTLVSGPASGSVFPVGTTVVTYSATDAGGNTVNCSFRVTVNDVEAPQLVGVPANTTVECTSVPASANVTASDNCPGVGNVNFTEQRINGNCAGNYTLKRTWTVTDAHGNTSSATQTITVQDTEGPAITCPASKTVNCQDDTSPAALGSASATDACSGVVSITSNSTSTQHADPNNSGHYNYVITRTWTATDACGNSTSCVQTITVKDDTDPVAICQNVAITLENGEASITTAMINNGSSDNCSPLTFSLSRTDFSCADIGTHTVTLTVKDVSGNTSTCTATVTVNGEIPTCSIASVPANNTYTGGVSTNLYLGYGPQSTTLQLSVPASGAPYTFLWSGNGTLSSNTVQSPVFAPGAAGTYTFTVFITNKYGCTTSCTISICVTDIRVPGRNGSWDGKKVYVCHVPPGNPGNAQTLEISVNAVPAHIGPLGHATDRLGTCTQTPCTSNNSKAPIATDIRVSEELSVRLSPNPTSKQFVLQVMSSDNKTPVVVRIMDGYGRMIETQKGSADQLYRFGSNYISGVYYIEVMQGEKKKVVQGVKAN